MFITLTKIQGILMYHL